MNTEQFLEYVAEFNPDYVTRQTAIDIINQAKKILSEDEED